MKRAVETALFSQPDLFGQLEGNEAGASPGQHPHRNRTVFGRALASAKTLVEVTALLSRW